jgi:hypothetical protein
VSDAAAGSRSEPIRIRSQPVARGLAPSLLPSPWVTTARGGHSGCVLVDGYLEKLVTGHAPFRCAELACLLQSRYAVGGY